MYVHMCACMCVCVVYMCVCVFYVDLLDTLHGNRYLCSFAVSMANILQLLIRATAARSAFLYPCCAVKTIGP